ncbi:hypothetical protein [Pontibacter ramchanderi]|uniref:Uncharacterized protein n=1 Tax=Pontibacter ramchanderi TaxID=1179743 RepID=A0A2N3V3L2_9BACT|nr:hypothetical protein [Pontibacter ramchanderi]PKV76225.1 hypothetical protein BD749_1175 [Pontibacter ramchanderi]
MEFNNYILLYGPQPEDVVAAVQQMTDLYADSGFTEGIRVYRATAKDDLFLLNFTNQPDFERFKYFVNYLTYPEVENFEAKTLGYWTVTAGDKLPQQYTGQRALVYVSEQDTEGDNVHAVFEEQDNTIKMGFASGEEFKVLGKKEFPFSEPTFASEDFSLMSTFTPAPSRQKETKPGCSFLMASFLAFGIFCLWLII